MLPAIFQASTIFGARRRAASAWLVVETHFLEIIPSVTVLKAVCFPIQFLKRKVKSLYYVDNEVVDDLRRFTSAYVKKSEGLPIIPALPRREYKKKYRPILEDAVLVEDLKNR